jgi:hypothetical protein
MYCALRRGRGARTVLLMTAVLAAGSSFGLHPEPFRSAVLSAEEDRGPALNTAAHPGRIAHGCLACLAHRSLSLPQLSAVVLQGGPGLHLGAACADRSVGRLVFAEHDGRAPPSLS